MGEILSTIELIMQRTQGMSLSQEEKHSLHREELRKKAKGFFVKLIEHPDSIDDILRSVRNEPPGDSEILTAMIWNEMAVNIPGRKAILKHIDAMEKIPHEEQKGKLLGELKAELNATLKNLSKDMKSLVNGERKKLAAFGISGSAVIPNVSIDSLFETISSDIIVGYKDKLLTELV